MKYRLYPEGTAETDDNEIIEEQDFEEVDGSSLYRNDYIEFNSLDDLYDYLESPIGSQQTPRSRQ